MENDKEKNDWLGKNVMSELIYIIVLLSAYLLAYLAQRKKKKSFLIPLILLLTVAAGYRGVSVGIDTAAYYAHIQSFFPNHWQFRETGFRLVSNTIMNITNNPQYVFLLCAFVTNLLIVIRLWDYKDEAQFSFMVLLYLLLYYSNSMNIMRQYVAVALIFFGTKFLEQKKYYFFLPFLVAGFFFHRSSLLGIGYLVVALWGSFSKKQKHIFAIPMLLVIAVSIVYVSTYLAWDVTSYSSQTVSNINITYFYRLFIFLVVIFLEKNKKTIKIGLLTGAKRTKKLYQIDKVITLYYSIGLAFSALSMFYAFVGRTGLYYMIYEVVFWGIASRNLKNRKVYAIIVLVLSFYEFAQIFTRNAGGIFPYYIYINQI